MLGRVPRRWLMVRVRSSTRSAGRRLEFDGGLVAGTDGPQVAAHPRLVAGSVPPTPATGPSSCRTTRSRAPFAKDERAPQRALNSGPQDRRPGQDFALTAALSPAAGAVPGLGRHRRGGGPDRCGLLFTALSRTDDLLRFGDQQVADLAAEHDADDVQILQLQGDRLAGQLTCPAAEQLVDLRSGRRDPQLGVLGPCGRFISLTGHGAARPVDRWSSTWCRSSRDMECVLRA